MASALPFSIRHAIVGGTASGNINAQVAKYNVRQGGSNTVSTIGELSTVYLVVTKVYQVVPWVV